MEPIRNAKQPQELFQLPSLLYVSEPAPTAYPSAQLPDCFIGKGFFRSSITALAICSRI